MRSPAGDISNEEGFLKAISGLPVGSSRRQGMIRDNRFYHADYQLTMAFPKGWQIINEPEQILAIGPNKEHFMELRAQAPPSDVTDPRDFAMRGLANRRLERPESLEINGLHAWTAVVHGDPSPFGQSTNVRYIIIYYNNLMWVFKAASRSGTVTPSGDPYFLSTAQTFRRMRTNEFPLAEPYRLHIVKAVEGDTIEELAKTSSIKKYPVQQLRLFNDLYPDGRAEARRPGSRSSNRGSALTSRHRAYARRGARAPGRGGSRDSSPPAASSATVRLPPATMNSGSNPNPPAPRGSWPMRPSQVASAMTGSGSAASRTKTIAQR